MMYMFWRPCFCSSRLHTAANVEGDLSLRLWISRSLTNSRPRSSPGEVIDRENIFNGVIFPKTKALFCLHSNDIDKSDRDKFRNTDIFDLSWLPDDRNYGTEVFVVEKILNKGTCCAWHFACVKTLLIVSSVHEHLTATYMCSSGSPLHPS